MIFSKRIRGLMRKAAVGFYQKLQKEPNYKFVNNAYYISLDGVLLSAQPFIGWKNAYRRAKAKHHRAFIIRGSTMNKALIGNQWGAHKRAWSGYGA